MTAQSVDVRHRLNAVLAPYEGRPVPLTRDEIAERQRGAALGAELNRLQGARPDGDARRRLMALHCRGQVSRAEFVELSRLLARERLHDVELMEVDGR